MQVELLDFGDIAPEASHFGRSRKLAWPVCAYRVTLPSDAGKGDNSLNPFERVILGLLDAGGASTEEALAQETRIPEDFVRGVLLRLRDRGFIDEHNKIGNKEALETTVNYSTAIIYRELVGGRVLPYLHASELETKTSDVHKRLDGHNGINAQISPKEVVRAANDMQKHLTAHGSKVFTPAQGQISIAESHERYFIECPVVMWEKDGDFRIVDPFGNGGYSLVLENTLAKTIEEDDSLSNWFTEWRKSLASTQGNHKSGQASEPYDNDVCRKRYPELVSALKLKRNSPYRSLEKLHAALEWAMFYSCMKYDYEGAINMLEIMPQPEQSKTLEYAAYKIGLDVSSEKFRPLKKEGINGFKNGNPDMNTVLALTLLAADDNARHPLNAIAKEYPAFIAIVQRIKRSRDQSGHGKGIVSRQYEELPDEPFVKFVVSTLLPDVKFSEADISASVADAIADARFDARTSLLDVFGYGAFNNKISSNAKDRLISAERFWMTCEDGEDALSFIVDIYSALQAEFRRKLGFSFVSELRESDFIAAASSKAQNAGLGALPEELRTVKLHWIRDALQGNDQSLGAAVVAFILASEDDTLKKIAEFQPGFIEGIAKVINTRGHANKSVLLQKNDIANIRKTAYLTIKVLVEA
jgi:hypothetical protein